MGSTAGCSHMQRRTMDKEMVETDNMRAWLSLANTVLVSIAMVLWYFAIWQEEKEEIDESKVVIIENVKTRPQQKLLNMITRNMKYHDKKVRVAKKRTTIMQRKQHKMNNKARNLKTLKLQLRKSALVQHSSGPV